MYQESNLNLKKGVGDERVRSTANARSVRRKHRLWAKWAFGRWMGFFLRNPNFPGKRDGRSTVTDGLTDN